MNKKTVTIIDYGIGNLLSVQRAIENCNAETVITNDPKIILNSDRVILPGVGAFGNAMSSLKSQNLIEVILEFAKQDKPLLGICLGMQILLDKSEEFGLNNGLGLISGKVVSLKKTSLSNTELKVPHIGWNSIKKLNNDNTEFDIMHKLNSNPSVYFIHSYIAVPNDPSNIVAECNYGDNRISAIIMKNKVIGCQFHPEKSGQVGLQILQNFLQQ